jgi:hypothetical protein
VASTPTTNGWVEDAEFTYNSITFLNGDWNVPSAPSSSNGQTIFLFDGLEPSNSGSIVQPVLQYGTSAAGGGNYWICASWYVISGGNYCYASPINVAVGDQILGQIAWTTSGQWYITCQDNNTNAASLLSTGNAITETQAFATLEVYGVSSCNEYPASGSTAFSQLGVQVGVTPSWTGQVLINDGCGESVNVISSSAVTLNY